MITSKIRSKAAIAFGVALAIILSIGFFQSIARADISNPHPTPPAGSVTNTVLAPNTILDSNVNTAAAIQVTKIKGGNNDGTIPYSASAGLATSTSLTFTPTNNTFTVTASTSLTATTSIAASSVTNNAIVLNTVPYQFPSTQGAAATVLQNNGSGVLQWQPGAGIVNIIQNNIGQGTGSTGTTTVYDVALPAASLNTVKMLEIRADWNIQIPSGGSNCLLGIRMGNGAASTTIAYAATTGGTQYPEMIVDVYPQTSTSEQFYGRGMAGTTQDFKMSGLLTFTLANLLGFDFQATNQTGGSNTCNLQNVIISVYS